MTNERAIDGALVRGMGLAGLYVAVASALRLAQDAAIAWRHGTGPEVDAFYLLMGLANWPLTVALSLLSLLIAPVDARLRSGEPAAAVHFRRELLGAVLVVAVASLPFAWWALRGVAGSALGGLDAGAAALATSGALGIAPMVSLGIVAALFSAWLVAAGRQVVTLLEGLPALVLVAIVLLWPGPALYWGAALGFAVQVAVMVWVLRRAGELPAPRTGFTSPHWHGFGEGAWLLLGTQVLFAMVPLVDALFAARLGEGAVAQVSYTGRLVLGILGLAGLALQRAGLPLLANLSLHAPAQARRAAARWAIGMAVLGTVGAVVIAMLADPLVALLFERGNFTAADREQCAQLLRFAMPQVPMYLVGTVFITALAAASARRALAVLTLLNVAAKLAANFVLVPWLGASGLMLASGVMYAVAAIASGYAVMRHFRGAA